MYGNCFLVEQTEKDEQKALQEKFRDMLQNLNAVADKTLKQCISWLILKLKERAIRVPSLK